MPRILLCLSLLAVEAHADDEYLTVAVASNFLATAQSIAAQYTEAHGVPVRLVSGSTGKLYAQIVNGAPYDVFLAADDERPALLESAGLTRAGRRITYAYGQLWIFSASRATSTGSCRDALLNGAFDKLAIANPATAPYGRAAKEYLERIGVWQRYRSRIVLGESVSQARHFVATGNAELGVGKPGDFASGCQELVDGDYGPIRQQGVVLARTHQPEAAEYFIEFLRRPAILDVIKADGYLAGVE